MKPNRNLSIILLAAFLHFHLGAYAQIEWEPVVDWDNEIFPSYVLATIKIDFEKYRAKSKHYVGDVNGFVGITATASKPNQKILIEISSTKLIQKTVLEAILVEPGNTYRIYPQLNYNYDELGKIREPVPESITFSLYANNQLTGTKTKTTNIRSINDCPFALVQENKPIEPLHWMFSAYVNENHPLIGTILKDALDYKIVNQFKGYQGTSTEVYEEVFAIWNALQQRGIKYSDITTTSEHSKKVFSQYVRAVEDSLEGSQANCVDGSVLLASIFRKLGLRTYLILVPGHCFVGVCLSPNDSAMFIETTDIGNVDVNKLGIERGINSLLSGREHNLSRSNFEQALLDGQRKKEDARAKIMAKEPGYYLIDIDKAREMGIQPLKSRAVALPPIKPATF